MGQITYTLVGDYLFPDLTLCENPPSDALCESFGRYARMRRAFLREHRVIAYNALLLSEQLFSHLWEVQEKADERLEGIMSDVLMFNPPPDKAADGITWAAHMVEAQRDAEKMVLDEVVYA